MVADEQRVHRGAERIVKEEFFRHGRKVSNLCLRSQIDRLNEYFYELKEKRIIDDWVIFTHGCGVAHWTFKLTKKIIDPPTF